MLAAPGLRTITIQSPAVFEPLRRPARYKGIHGGRGSGKSHDRADALIERHLDINGCRSLCCREIQKTLQQSAKKLIEGKLRSMGLATGKKGDFRIFRDVIETPGDGIMLFNGLRDHTADSIKSLEGLDTAWIEEAQTVTKHSLTLLRPSVRNEGSEIWATWNPRLKTDAIDELLRSKERPANSIVIQANYNDNPFFPKVLEEERADDFLKRASAYPHVWEGAYATVLEGAYFALELLQAKQTQRIDLQVTAEPLNKTYAFWDLAGTGDKADAVAIVIVQFIGAEVRILDYYEAVGQAFSYHVNWLQSRGWGDAFCVLPHDGDKHDTVYDATAAAYLGQAGFGVDVVQNQGKGAAMLRINALREIFHSIRFNSGLGDPDDPDNEHEDPTKALREALGWYHEKKDPVRLIGLGPEHDWASHGCDAAGLMAIWRRMNPSGRSIRSSSAPPRRSNAMTS